MRTRHSLNLLAVIVLIVLSACSAKPAPAPAAPPVTAPRAGSGQQTGGSAYQPTCAADRCAAPHADARAAAAHRGQRDARSRRRGCPGRARSRHLRPADGSRHHPRGVRHRAQGEGRGQGAGQRADLLARRAAEAQGGVPGHAGRERHEFGRLAAPAPHRFQVHHHRHAGGDEHPAGRRRRPGEHGEHDHGRVQPAGRAARRHRRASGPAPAAGYHPHADRQG